MLDSECKTITQTYNFIKPTYDQVLTVYILKRGLRNYLGINEQDRDGFLIDVLSLKRRWLQLY